MPSHNHGVQCDTNALNTSVASPSGTVPGNTSPHKIYSATTTPSAQMNPFMIGIAGSSLPHNNLQPYLVLNYCIALQGVYPSRP
jgi:microcystin-dependent protein